MSTDPDRDATVNKQEIDREAAFAACKPFLPTRYLSDPDVINDAEQTKILQAQWDEYFRRMREVDEKYPSQRISEPNGPETAKVTLDTTTS